MSVKKVIKEYFSYSTSEKRGLLVLVVILITVFVLPELINSDSEQFYTPKKYENLDSLIALLNDKDKSIEPDLFSFNPNTVSADDLKRLGLRDYQIRNIVKYRNKGGVFKLKSDFAKIYGITERDYHRLQDHIDIPVSIKPSKPKKVAKKGVEVKLFKFDPNTITKAEWEKLGVDKGISNRIIKYLSTGAKFQKPDDLAKIYGFDTVLLKKLMPYVQIKSITRKVVKVNLVDLNSADTILLKTLPGIGKTLSRRIVNYKNLLGGFHDKSQLLEVYGISAETFQKIENRVCVSSEYLQKISINECDVKSLSKHPYISRRMSSDIVNYRERIGKFHSIEELKIKHLLSDSVYVKVEPYLSIQ